MRISDWSSDVCSSDLLFGIVEVDRGQPGQREIALAVLGRADFPFHRVAGAQAELADLGGAYVDVVRTGQIIGLRAAQEAETVGQHLDRAGPHDLLAVFGHRLQRSEEHTSELQYLMPISYGGDCDKKKKIATTLTTLIFILK